MLLSLDVHVPGSKKCCQYVKSLSYLALERMPRYAWQTGVGLMCCGARWLPLVSGKVQYNTDYILQYVHRYKSTQAKLTETFG